MTTQGSWERLSISRTHWSWHEGSLVKRGPATPKGQLCMDWLSPETDIATTRDICSQPDVWSLDRVWKVDVTAPISTFVICVDLPVWGCLGFDLKCVVAFWRLGSSLGDYVEMILFLHRDLVGVAAEEKQMQRREERKGEGGNEKEKVREEERGKKTNR